MSVLNRSVIMRVGVGDRFLCVLVLVVMVAIVMPVPVLVRHAVVPVNMAVLLTEENQQRTSYKRCRHGLSTGERLAQEQQR